MNQSKAKKIRKYVTSLQLDAKEENALYKRMKKERQIHLISNLGKRSVSKKQRIGESFEDFRKRRKVCNKKRREREKNVNKYYSKNRTRYHKCWY